MLALVTLAAIGCATNPEPEAPKPSAPPEAVTQPAPGAEAAPAAEASAEPASEAPAAPAFTPGMSVLDAQNAVPAGSNRLEVEQEALSAPLLRPELYAPCGVKGHQHFQIHVAVWQGRAVGLDIATTPADAKLTACLRDQLLAVEWPDKVASLNTVQYQQ
jgi:hypothetical protein